MIPKVNLINEFSEKLFLGRQVYSVIEGSSYGVFFFSIRPLFGFVKMALRI